MNTSKRRRLTAAGWKIGSAQEFLGLTSADAEYIELKLRLAHALAQHRARAGLSQVQAAKIVGSSQSRVAKMEAGDPTVSADLLIRSLLALGATSREVGRAVSSRQSPARRRIPPRTDSRPAPVRQTGRTTRNVR